MTTHRKQNIVIAVTGASGAIYARLLCEKLGLLPEVGEIALIFTHSGQQVAAFENEWAWSQADRFTRYENDNLFASPASGSASYEAMVVLPCSMGTLGRIAAGVSADLVGRAADVMLKERRRLILVPRETPLSTIALRNMTMLSECGAVICPAAPGFYARPQSIEQLCEGVVDRVIALLGLQAPHYVWGAE